MRPLARLPWGNHKPPPPKPHTVPRAPRSASACPKPTENPRVRRCSQSFSVGRTRNPMKIVCFFSRAVSLAGRLPKFYLLTEIVISWPSKASQVLFRDDFVPERNFMLHYLAMIVTFRGLLFTFFLSERKRQGTSGRVHTPGCLHASRVDPSEGSGGTAVPFPRLIMRTLFHKGRN